MSEQRTYRVGDIVEDDLDTTIPNDLLVTEHDGVWLVREIPFERPDAVAAVFDALVERGERLIHLEKWSDGQRTFATLAVKVESRDADSDVDVLRAVMDEHGLREADEIGFGLLIRKAETDRYVIHKVAHLDPVLGFDLPAGAVAVAANGTIRAATPRQKARTMADLEFLALRNREGLGVDRLSDDPLLGRNHWNPREGTSDV